MFKQAKVSAGRMGDALLARLAPKLDADAACGANVLCCVVQAGKQFQGWIRHDTEHNGNCTTCRLMWEGC